MNNIEFRAVVTDSQIEETGKLADAIWHEYFSEILTLEQIDYMVEKFQSVPALTEQIKDKGYEYFLLADENGVLGYTGIHREENALFLSKLYLLKEQRGKGYASKVFRFLEDYCRKYSLKKIWLTVNRYNDHTIQVYKNKGFVTARTQVTDIGKGFVMDDYIMERAI